MIDKTINEAANNDIDKRLIGNALKDIDKGAKPYYMHSTAVYLPNGELIKKNINEGKFVYCMQTYNTIDYVITFDNKKELDELLANSKAYQEIRAQLKEHCKDIDDKNDIDDEDEKF